MTFKTIFYDDPDLLVPTPRSIFLAGPTATKGGRTAWRAMTLEYLTFHKFTGTVIIPEFRDGLFTDLAPRWFSTPKSCVLGMRDTSYNILRWETAGIEHAAVVLFWMPFHLAAADDPSSLPGFTTRAEVSREIARDPSRIVLGMPPNALSGSHIRYHANQAGLHVHQTLPGTIDVALERVS